MIVLATRFERIEDAARAHALLTDAGHEVHGPWPSHPSAPDVFHVVEVVLVPPLIDKASQDEAIAEITAIVASVGGAIEPQRYSELGASEYLGPPRPRSNAAVAPDIVDEYLPGLDAVTVGHWWSTPVDCARAHTSVRRPALAYVWPGGRDGGVDPVALCRARAEALGWDIVSVHFDDWKATGWRRLRADLEAKRADAVVVFGGSRVSHTISAEALVGLADDYGAVSVVYAPEPGN